MTQYQDKAYWNEIDPATLSAKQATAYEAYKALYRTMKAARVTFETMMQQDVPEGYRMVFGYRFGKLSVAIVEAQELALKAQTKSKLSLADFLAAARSSGRDA